MRATKQQVDRKVSNKDTDGTTNCLGYLVSNVFDGVVADVAQAKQAIQWPHSLMRHELGLEKSYCDWAPTELSSQAEEAGEYYHQLDQCGLKLRPFAIQRARPSHPQVDRLWNQMPLNLLVKAILHISSLLVL